MSTDLGGDLPEVLLERLDGRQLGTYADRAILISTVDEGGWPHQAMLSHFELVARDRKNIRIAAYGNSTTTANMRRTGRATLTFVDERMAFYVKVTVEGLAPEMRTAPFNAKLNCRVERVLADEANEEHEPGAYVASGIRFQSPSRLADLPRARALIEELLE
jgi:hypothetical protein